MTLPRGYGVDGLTSCPMKYRAYTGSWYGPIRMHYREAVTDAWLHFGLPHGYKVVEIDALTGAPNRWRACRPESFWIGPLRDRRESAVEDAWHHAGPEPYKRYLEHTKTVTTGRRADTDGA